VVEMGLHGDYVAEKCAEVGLRAYIGEMYRSGRWYTDDGRSVKYEWFDDDGAKAMAHAVVFVEKLERAGNGLLKGFLTPAQVDTCSAGLLQRTAQLGREMQLPVALHTSQSVPEFQHMVMRHGCSPVEWLHQLGFLGDNVLLGHVIMPAGSSWVNYQGDDLQLLADTGTNVAHSVWVFARRGIAMESYARYLDQGINMILGADTCPQSMIEAMRWTAVVSKIQDRQTEVATARDVFNSATIAGAKALGRDDLGRIARGAQADLLFWEGASPFMTPLRDPIRNIVYSATPEDLNSTMIAGRMVMKDRIIPGIDMDVLTRDLQKGARDMWDNMQRFDWNRRNIETLSPSSFPPFRAQ